MVNIDSSERGLRSHLKHGRMPWSLGLGEKVKPLFKYLMISFLVKRPEEGKIAIRALFCHQHIPPLECMPPFASDVYTDQGVHFMIFHLKTMEESDSLHSVDCFIFLWLLEEPRGIFRCLPWTHLNLGAHLYWAEPRKKREWNKKEWDDTSSPLTHEICDWIR